MGRDLDHAIIARAHAQLTGKKDTFGVIHTDHRTIGATFGEQTALGGKIPAQPCVTIQMIRADICQHSEVRGKRAGQFRLIGR